MLCCSRVFELLGSKYAIFFYLHGSSSCGHLCRYRWMGMQCGKKFYALLAVLYIYASKIEAELPVNDVDIRLRQAQEIIEELLKPMVFPYSFKALNITYYFALANLFYMDEVQWFVCQFNRKHLV